MKLLYLECPEPECDYRTGASHPGDVGARRALLLHLKRRRHGMSHTLAKARVDSGRFVEHEYVPALSQGKAERP